MVEYTIAWGSKKFGHHYSKMKLPKSVNVKNVLSGLKPKGGYAKIVKRRL